MGACASFPKTLGGAAGKAPAPEQPKEETTEAVAVTDKAQEEVKAEEPKEKVKTAVEGQDEQKEKSLGSFLETTGEVKKETDQVAAPAVEQVVEEVKVAPAPVEEKKTEQAATTTEESKKE